MKGSPMGILLIALGSIFIAMGYTGRIQPVFDALSGKSGSGSGDGEPTDASNDGDPSTDPNDVPIDQQDRDVDKVANDTASLDTKEAKLRSKGYVPVVIHNKTTRLPENSGTGNSNNIRNNRWWCKQSELGVIGDGYYCPIGTEYVTVYDDAGRTSKPQDYCISGTRLFRLKSFKDDGSEPKPTGQAGYVRPASVGTVPLMSGSMGYVRLAKVRKGEGMQP